MLDRDTPHITHHFSPSGMSLEMDRKMGENEDDSHADESQRSQGNPPQEIDTTADEKTESSK